MADDDIQTIGKNALSKVMKSQKNIEAFNKYIYRFAIEEQDDES